MPLAIDLHPRIALITGASQGIGACLARRFHEAGATVWINHPGIGSTGADAEALADSLGDRCRVVEADVSRAGAVERMYAEIRERDGGLDILINNAAILRDRTLAKMTLEEWGQVIDINLTGVFHCCKYGLEIMRDQGSIVSMGSIAGLQGFFGQANYAAAKAGVMAMTKVLSRETARRGIRVNAIAPGVVETRMAEQIPEAVRKEMLALIPLGRFAKPEEIADTAVYLSSPMASYITGQIIEVNGGWRG